MSEDSSTLIFWIVLRTRKSPTPIQNSTSTTTSPIGVIPTNQVWAADITYLPVEWGFLYLVAVMDWHSRYVLSWRLSNTL